MRFWTALTVALLSAFVVVSVSPAQPPGEGKGKAAAGKAKGLPPWFEPGRAVPPALRADLKLTPSQEQQLAVLDAELKARLDALLSDAQKQKLAALRAAGPVPASAAPPGRKPNLVLIFADDLGYADIGPFGSVKNRTPHLDRMAAEGMRLTSFYGCPVCTPSRAQLMTGCYAKRVSLPNVIFPRSAVGLHPDERTLADLLKRQGYATACVGKWHLGDQPEFLPTRRGFDRYFGLPYSNDMGGTADGKRPPLPLLRDEAVIETVTPEGQNRLTARYTEEAVEFIRANRQRPFFLYLPHTAVHNPYHPGEAFRGKSRNGVYGDWVEELDWSVGRVLDTLRELKLEGDTLVLFTSDNGGTQAGSNAPLRGFKFSTWEGGMREPTLAWWSGRVPAGATCDAVAGNIDVLPTFVGLAGGVVSSDRKTDGRDIAPLLLGTSRQSPHEAYFYFRGATLDAVRAGKWKLLLATGSLYDLEADVGEAADVAAANPDVVHRLRGYAAAMAADLGAEGNRPGPGVRPAGRVAAPQTLRLP